QGTQRRPEQTAQRRGGSGHGLLPGGGGSTALAATTVTHSPADRISSTGACTVLSPCVIMRPDRTRRQRRCAHRHAISASGPPVMSNRSAALMLAAGAALISLTGILVRYADVPATVSAFWRMLFGGGILALALLPSGVWRQVRRGDWMWMLLPAAG